MRNLILLATLVFVSPLCAATLTVTNLSNAGAGSLRDTVAAAVSGDDIVFDASLAGGTLTLASEISLAGKTVTITGLVDGAGKPAITISGNDAVRIFISTNSPVTIADLRLLDGRSTTGSAVAVGNQTLSATNCVFEGNTSTSLEGGAVVASSGAFVDCTFLGNEAPAGSAAGAVTSSGSTTFDRCSFVGNMGGTGGAVALVASSGNRQHAFTNCTFSGNEATGTSGGAIYAIVAPFTGGGSMALQFTHCTFADNSAMTGAAGQCFYFSAGGTRSSQGTMTCSFHGCILYDALTEAMFLAPSVTFGTVTVSSTGYNVSSDSHAFFAGLDLSNTDPMLLALADNGGLTPTHALDLPSPALNAGDPASTLLIDQRGLPRRDADIGAYELQPGVLGVQRGATQITDGGYVIVAATGEPSVAVSETFTLTGAGSSHADLALTLPITLSAAVNCNVSVTTPPSAVIAQGASSDLEISITPIATGFYSFTVTIVNDSYDGSFSYDVVGFAASGGSSSGGGGDGDEACSTGTHTNFGWLALAAIALLLAVRPAWRRAA